MYIEDYDTEEEIQEEKDENRFLKNLLKVLVIIFIVLLILLLVTKCSKKDNNYDSNVNKVRLASEKYYFLDENYKNEYIETNLNTLINKNYLDKVVDSNGNSCDLTNSIVSMNEDGENYIMNVHLICGKNNKENKFLYRKEDKKCTNCGKDTYMDGSLETKYNLSCTEFSEYSTKKLNDNGLEERVKTMVIAYKPGYSNTETTYSNWGNWTDKKINPSTNIEVDTKVVTLDNWSEEKTTTVKPIESSTLKITDTKTTTSTVCTNYKTSCPSGYSSENNKCVKKTYKTYKYTDFIKLSTSKQRDCSANGNKTWSCVTNRSYIDKISTCTNYSTVTTTVYTYMENNIENKTQYRSRTKTVHTVTVPDQYTDLINKTDIPTGYKIKSGSEVNYYSYKVKVCSK